MDYFALNYLQLVVKVFKYVMKSLLTCLEDNKWDIYNIS